MQSLPQNRRWPTCLPTVGVGCSAEGGWQRHVITLGEMDTRGVCMCANTSDFKLYICLIYCLSLIPQSSSNQRLMSCIVYVVMRGTILFFYYYCSQVGALWMCAHRSAIRTTAGLISSFNQPNESRELLLPSTFPPPGLCTCWVLCLDLLFLLPHEL